MRLPTIRMPRRPHPIRWAKSKMPARATKPPLPAVQPHRGGKFMAYLLAVLTTAAAVLVNITHADEGVGPQAMAGTVPVVLLLCAVLVHLYPTRSVRLPVLGVAVSSFAVSAVHTYGLAREYHEPIGTAVLYPAVLEFGMTAAIMALAYGRHGQDKAAVGASAVLSVPATHPEPVRKAVRPAIPAPASVLSEDKAEDRPRTNGFVRPMPPRTEDKRPSAPQDNDARLSAAREIADELGDKLSRAKLVEELAKRGYPIATNAAAILTRELKGSRS